MECFVQKVDKDYRIFLPQLALKWASWISGEALIEAWLLVAGPGRCRLLQSFEVENDAGCRSLRAAIDAGLDQPLGDLLEFRDETSVTLGLRLQPVQIAPPGPGWRLTLPRAVAAIMQVRPKESSVALLFSQGHVEIWTLETLRASVGAPLKEIV